MCLTRVTMHIARITLAIAAVLLLGSCGGSDDASAPSGSSSGNDLQPISADDIPGGSTAWTTNGSTGVFNSTGAMLHRDDPCIAAAQREAGIRRSTSANQPNSDVSIFIRRNFDVPRITYVVEVDFEGASQYVESISEFIEDCGGMVRPTENRSFFDGLTGTVVDLPTYGDRQISISYKEDDGDEVLIDTIVQQGNSLLFLGYFVGGFGTEQEDFDNIDVILARSFDPARSVETPSETHTASPVDAGESATVDSSPDNDPDLGQDPLDEGSASDIQSINLDEVTVTTILTINEDYDTSDGEPPDNPMALLAAEEDLGSEREQLKLGQALDLEGDVLVAGGPTGLDFGQVQIYRRAASGWVLETELTSPTVRNENGYGRSVALDGEMLLVGAPGRGAGGEVHVYRSSGGSWELEQTLVGPGPDNELFGMAVATGNGKLFVSGQYREAAVAQIYVFEDGASGWQLSGVVFDGAESFGTIWIEVNGDTLATSTSITGRVDLYQYRDGVWSQTAAVEAFGSQGFALSSSLLVVSSDHVLWVLERGDEGLGDPVGLIVDGFEDGIRPHFGGQTAIDGDFVIVAADTGSYTTFVPDSVEVFQRSNSGWEAIGRYRPSLPDREVFYGFNFDNGVVAERGLLVAASERRGLGRIFGSSLPG